MTYRRLLEFVKPYRSRLALALVCMVLFSIFNTAIVWVFKFVLKIAFVSKTPSMLVMVPCLIFVTFLLRGLADYGQAYYMSWVGLRAVSDIREKVYEHLHRLTLSYFAGKKTGQLISRITNDVAVVQYSISNAITDLVKEPLSLVGLVATLFYFDTYLATLSLIIFPLGVYPVIKYGKKVRESTKRAQSQVGDLTAILHETVTGIRVVKAFSMEEYEIDRFKEVNRRFFRSMMDAVRASEINKPIIEMVAACGAAFCFWYGAKHLTLDTFLSFLTALFLVYQPFKKLGRLNNVIQQATAAGGRIFEILDTVPAIVDSPQAKILENVRQGITFSHVSFRYEKHWVLKDINFEMKAGEIIALVGPSGTGKSTLANLIARFYDPEVGDIIIDGLNLRDISVKSLRGVMGMVTQEVILFNDTVLANIAYGRKDMSFEKVVEAAKAANAHDFIMSFPEGYNAMVGEKGVKVSGGERQRIAIARAILKNPRLLILDEATSSLDSESERLVQEALSRLMVGRTVLVIAHRLSTVRNANKILVLDKGMIIESGTHESLIKDGGLYKRLYEAQFSI